jgi:hypothetical protein
MNRHRPVERDCVVAHRRKTPGTAQVGIQLQAWSAATDRDPDCVMAACGFLREDRAMADGVVSILNELIETSKGGEPTRSTAGGSRTATSTGCGGKTRDMNCEPPIIKY